MWRLMVKWDFFSRRKQHYISALFLASSSCVVMISVLFHNVDFNIFIRGRKCSGWWRNEIIFVIGGSNIIFPSHFFFFIFWRMISVLYEMTKLELLLWSGKCRRWWLFFFKFSRLRKEETLFFCLILYYLYVLSHDFGAV